VPGIWAFGHLGFGRLQRTRRLHAHVL
jgi:hypothetical protein